MSSEDLLLKLYDQIETELMYCDEAYTPFVCGQFSDVEARADIVRTIAETCISMKINIAQAIVQVEKTYNLNMLD